MRKISLVCLSMLVAFSLVGCSFQTKETNSSKKENDIMSADMLEDGKMYILKDGKYTSTLKVSDNFDNDVSNTPNELRLRWYKIKDIEDEKDSLITNKIPTLYKGDKLILCYSDEIPADGFSFERFQDLKYTIGVYNLEKQQTKKYALNFDDDCIVSGSSAEEIETISKNDVVILGSIGNTDLTFDKITSTGTILGLDRNKEYDFNFYSGTFKKTLKLTADIRLFSSMSVYTSFNYRFIQDNVIEIGLPSSLETGYYSVQGFGLFRYVNGSSFDANTDFNKYVETVYNNPEGPISVDLEEDEEETTMIEE